MGKGNSVENPVIDTVAKTVEAPQQTDISLQDLAYLYQVFVSAAIPGNDIEFAAELKRKLKVVLNIK